MAPDAKKRKIAKVPDKLTSKDIDAALDSTTWKLEALEVNSNLLAAQSSAVSQLAATMNNSVLSSVGEVLGNLARDQINAYSQIAKAIEASGYSNVRLAIEKDSSLAFLSQTAANAFQPLSELQSVVGQFLVLDAFSMYRNAFSNLALNLAALTAVDVSATAITIACNAARQFNDATKFAAEQAKNIQSLDVKLTPNELKLLKPLEISNHLVDFENVAKELNLRPEGPEVIRLRKELAQSKRREKELERIIKELQEAQRVKPVDENERMFG
jgi:hypothetical protein